MAALEEQQRQFEDPRLTRFEFKVLSTLRSRAIRWKFFIAQSSFGWLFDDHPSPALRAGDARARDAIRRSMIVLRLKGSDLNRDEYRRAHTLLDLEILWPYAHRVVNATVFFAVRGRKN
jgi:hypothetical protein